MAQDEGGFAQQISYAESSLQIPMEQIKFVVNFPEILGGEVSLMSPYSRNLSRSSTDDAGLQLRLVLRSQALPGAVFKW